MLRLFVPSWHIGKEMFAHHAWLWDPFRNMGQPFLASPQNQALYPIRLIAVPLSFLNYLRISAAFHTALLFLPTYRLLRRNSDSFTSWVGPAAVAFNGLALCRFTLIPHFSAMAWAPLALLCLNDKRRLALALTLTMQWLAGFPPFFLLMLALLTAACVADESPQNAFRCFIGAVIIALGLSAVQIFPFIEMLRESARPMFLDAAASVEYSMHPLELVRQLIVPSFVLSSLPPLTNSDPAVIGCFVGPTLTVFFLIGLWKGGRRARWMGAASLLFFTLSLGRYIGVYEFIPLVSLFRFPANWTFPAVLLMVLTASTGLASIQRTPLRIFGGALLVLDLLIAAFPPATYWADEAFVTSVKKNDVDKTHRIFHTALITDRVQTWAIRSPEDWRTMKRLLVPSIAAGAGWREAFSFDVMTSRRTFDYATRLNQAGLGSPLLNYADVGVAVSVTQQGLEKPTPQEGDGGPMNNAGALGRAFFSDGAGRLRVVQDEPGELILETDGHGTVVASEAFYPGWRVQVDGETRKPQIFEKMFLTTSVPSGTHSVRFFYRPISFLAGASVSLLTLLLCGLVAAPMRGRAARVDVNERAV